MIPGGSAEALRDGRVVTLRSLRGADAAGIEALWRRLDATARRRFLELAHLAPDPPRPGAVAAPRPGHAAGIVATDLPGPPARIVGVARYERVAADAAAFSVFVDAAYRRAGLGTLLLRRLAGAARRAGVRRLVSDVPKDDVAVLGLLAELGLEYAERPTAATVHASFAVQETGAYLDAVLADQRAAASAALGPFLRPASIAVVGASGDPGSIGGLLLANLLDSGFAGPVYPVNPRHQVIRGVRCYPDLRSCPAVPDLVLVAVPAALVAGIVGDAGGVGSRAVCVISAGFAEVGGEGRALQEDLLRRARAAGVRLVGPNCMGLLNGGPEPRFNATFSPVFPPPGRLAFVSQSGGLGLAALALLAGPSLGVGGFASLGNTADLGPNDLLLYWDQDPGTDLVLAYLESVPDPRRFARIARRVSRHKPVVVVKAGRTVAGRRAASSHTAALAAGEAAVDALFRQAGVIRAGTLEEMFDVAAVVSVQPAPAGRRVAVLTNGGGPGILVADACEAAGLLVPVLSEGTQAALRAGLPPQAAAGNPVDMTAGATAGQYGRCLRLLGAAEEVEAVIVVFIPPFLTRASDVAREVAAAAGDLRLAGKPVVAVFMTSGPPPGSLAEAGVPAFTYPERAAAALGHVAGWAEWRARPAGRVVTPPGIDPGRGRAAVSKVLGGQPGGGWADAAAAGELLAAYGIPAVRTRRVRTPEEAAAAQAGLGGPVVVKIAAAIHKSDVGGVAVGLATPQAAAGAVTAIRAALTDAGLAGQAAEFLVQEQVRDGVEMIAGVTHDPAFGPIVMAGLGGTTVEVLGDVAVRLTPLSDTDVDEMLRSLRSYRLLTGYRHAPPLDVAAYAELLHRVSAMAEDIPEITELDLNPVFVRGHGAVVADVRIRLTG
ncbi:MAG TPA: GNAT family N-acetyltransferase [Streptosporangiaceae bacterium]|nr:GNAT family N-acetyltransferase [Streptosporangiaceae bacterium]